MLELVLLFAVALALMLYGIGDVAEPVFDEKYYLSAAYAWLVRGVPLNLEHPPLAKFLMAGAIGVFGNAPFAWRLMSAVFGASIVTGMYVLGKCLLADRRAAYICAAITLFNGLLFVQARVAMLDVFMVGFLVWAAVAAVWVLRRPGRMAPAASFAFLCGLAVASKEFAVLPAVILFALVAVGLATRGRLGRAELSRFVCVWGVVAGGAYLAPFVPLIFAEKYRDRTVLDVLTSLQLAIWKYQWLEIKQQYDHPYRSVWWQWVLLIRPIWFHYGAIPLEPRYARGIVMLGNPLVMWGGLLSVVYCAYAALRHRNAKASACVAIYASLTLCWPFIARKEAFYYYYFPAGMVLSLTLALALQALRRRFSQAVAPLRHLDLVFALGCCGLFAVFYPVYAGARILDEDFMRWIWLDSWL